MSNVRPFALLGSGMLAITVLGAACGSDSGGVEASDAWARTSPMSAENGAAYMVLSADEQTSIVSVSVPTDVAGRAELHETVPVDMEEAMEDGEMEDEAMEDEVMEDMAMTMQEVTSIDIPAGGEAVLEPGGLHLMLLDLPDPLEEGEEFDVTLTTDAGDEITVAVEVRSEAP